MGYLEDGVVEIKDIQVPSEERFQEGPIALIECVQEIPCDPCVDSCPQGAITMGDSINNVPEIDFDKCTKKCFFCFEYCPDGAVEKTEYGPVINFDYCKGCGICAVECPKEAIEMETEEK